MPGFGERLKQERESHNTTIEEIAAASGIGQSYLEALEQDDFPSLPGPAFGKLYIRAYAEVLGFDPQPWIDDYDRERRAAIAASAEPTSTEPARTGPVGAALAEWREARIRERDAPPAEAAPLEAAPLEAAPAEAGPAKVAPGELAPSEIPTDEPAPAARASVPVSATALRSRRPIALYAVAGVLVGAAVIYVAVFRGAPERSAPVRAVTPTPPLVDPAPVSPPAGAVRPPSTPRPEKPVTRAATAPPPAMVITESGVGRRIVNLRLEGEADTFPEGSRVCFASRVIGGRSGAIVRHVWIRDGRIEQSIPLRLGGPDWRTHSAKTLGRPGAWTVEARDEEGRVLASASFACVPAGR
jgi:transcriptional regulator with XRE-family HTH domain